MTFGILVSQPGIKLVPLAVKTRVLNHWTTKEFPGKILLLNRMFFRSFRTVSIMKCFIAIILLYECATIYISILFLTKYLVVSHFCITNNAVLLHLNLSLGIHFSSNLYPACLLNACL